MDYVIKICCVPSVSPPVPLHSGKEKKASPRTKEPTQTDSLAPLLMATNLHQAWSGISIFPVKISDSSEIVLRMEGGMALGYLPGGWNLIILPTVGLGIFKSIDSTFHPVRPNRPDAFFNQLAPTT